MKRDPYQMTHHRGTGLIFNSETNKITTGVFLAEIILCSKFQNVTVLIQTRTHMIRGYPAAELEARPVPDDPPRPQVPDPIPTGCAFGFRFFPLPFLEFWVLGFGFWVLVLGFGVWGWGLECGVLGSGFCVLGSGILGFGIWVMGFGIRD